MNILVTYQSKTGFTQKYAEWISERLGCELKELADVTPEDISSNDFVIHGGWIRGGVIKGLDKIKNLKPRMLIVFGVGFTAKTQAYTAKCIVVNKIRETPFFYFEGGMDPSKLSSMEKRIVKLVTKKVPEYADHTDKNEIEELVEFVLSCVAE